MGPGWRQNAGGKPLDWDGKTPIEVTVRVDFEQHQLVAEALGQQVRAKIPPAWSALTGWGYGGNNAETVFGPITFR